MKHALLDILCCPLTHRPLKKAPRDVIEAVNRRIAAGEVRNRDDRPVTEPLTAALVTLDQHLLYPVVDDIPDLLPGSGIALEDA
jgi:uncharacterized protein YbaR (Trm112 family)